MRTDQTSSVVSLAHQAIQSRREAEARRVADGLIQEHIGPNYKVMSMPNFRSALVQALKAARIRGEDDAGDVLTLT
jgi:hypothetical protein